MIYDEWAVLVIPPRALGSAGTYTSNMRVVACNNATTAIELDNDVLQLFPNRPATYGRCLIRLHAEGNDLYVVFGIDANVAANSAATNAAATGTLCDRIPVGQEREFELNPTIDKFLSARTINGNTLTATLRYRIVTPPKEQYGPQ